jgi:chorismate mutase/prephenate dehydratase
MLQPFASRGISLSKIESRPTKRKAWDYYFFVDVMGHHDDPAMREAITDLRKFCPMVKWLGSYPVAG